MHAYVVQWWDFCHSVWRCLIFHSRAVVCIFGASTSHFSLRTRSKTAQWTRKWGRKDKRSLRSAILAEWAQKAEIHSQRDNNSSHRPYKVRSVASAQSQPARDSHKTTVYPVGPISLCINLYSSNDSYRWPLVNFFEKCTPRRLFVCFPFPQFCVICEKDSPSVPFGALAWSWGVV